MALVRHFLSHRHEVVDLLFPLQQLRLEDLVLLQQVLAAAQILADLLARQRILDLLQIQTGVLDYAVVAVLRGRLSQSSALFQRSDDQLIPLVVQILQDFANVL